MITPTFHFRILNDFLQVFEEQAVTLVSHVEVTYHSVLIIVVVVSSVAIAFYNYKCPIIMDFKENICIVNIESKNH